MPAESGFGQGDRRGGLILPTASRQAGDGEDAGRADRRPAAHAEILAEVLIMQETAPGVRAR
jgi:hypothetical protein